MADTEDRTRDLLREVLAHQAGHQHHRLVQPDRRGPSARPHDLAEQFRTRPVRDFVYPLLTYTISESDLMPPV
ncbi:hypothetical protein ACNPQM_09520 [Streptomyces sp. NPDC056231]|uniref:hypothetical protein n=1 Tax=Streptomyces sp. NPDC056231 TaxID=3345755 RepID=UPI003AB0B6D5